MIVFRPSLPRWRGTLTRERRVLVLPIVLSLASLACKRPLERVDELDDTTAPNDTNPNDAPPNDEETRDQPQVSSKSLRVGACPDAASKQGLKIPKHHRAALIDRWDGVRPLQARANQAQPPVPGRVQGLLASLAYFSGEPCHRTAPEQRVEYQFTNTALSHYAMYFVSSGGGFNFLRDWGVPLPDGSTAIYDAAMFGPGDGVQCLDACAHFVELEVNDGRGGLGLHFVATEVQVTDDRHAMNPAKVLEDLHRRFGDSVGQAEAELRKRYAEAQREAPDLRLGQRADEPLSLWPRWSEADATLEVLAWTQGRASASRKIGSETIEPSKCPPGAPCAYRETGTFDIYEELLVMHEVAVEYRVDDHGTLIEERVYPPRVEVRHGQDRRRR